MSAVTVAHVESKIQSFLLGPLWLCFFSGVLISAYFSEWLAAGINVFLCFYVGWIGSNLAIHRGKSFDELSQGVDTKIPDTVANEPADLSSEESLDLGLKMHHVLYAITIAAGSLSIAFSMRYWTILICIVVFMLGRGILFAAMSLMIMSVSRSMQRQQSR